MKDGFVNFLHVYAGYSPKKGLGKLFSPSANASSVVLRDVTLTLLAQDQIVVFGPSASGKTTLLRLISGLHIAHEGTVVVNGKAPSENSQAILGYVSADHTSSHVPASGTVHEVLVAFGKTYSIAHLPSRIGEVMTSLGLQEISHKRASGLSTSERVRLHMAYAALSDAPVILLDDIADILGADEVTKLLTTLFAGRCVCVATRNAEIAERLALPIYLLHKSSLAHTGTRESIAHDTGVTRIVDAWVEGLRYDLLRKLRAHPGVLEVRLLPTDQFDGNRVRITLRNSRYLPSLYDVVSQASLVRIEELPPSLTEILKSLS